MIKSKLFTLKLQPLWVLMSCLLGVLAVEVGTRLLVEVLWFAEVDYLGVLGRKLITQLGLGTVVLGISLGFLWGNLQVVDRLQHGFPLPNSFPTSSNTSSKSSPKISPQKSLRLRSLLPLTISLCLVISLLVWYYGRVLFDLWQADLNFANFISFTGFTSFAKAGEEVNAGFVDSPPLPIALFTDLPNVGDSKMGSLIRGGVFFLMPLLLLVKTRFLLRSIALLFSFVFTTVLVTNWEKFLQFLTPISFQQTDPLWGLDISFYVFKLPELELFRFWLVGMFSYGLISVVLAYLLSGDSIAQGKFPGFSLSQVRHLAALGSCLSGSLTIHFWLECYEILYSRGGASYGASYSDVQVALPLNIILSITSSILALSLGWCAVRYRLVPRLNHWLIYGSILCILSGSIANLTLPTVIQKLIVEPNELTQETTYIQNTIDFTRLAYDLNNIESKPFFPEDNLTAAEIQENSLTIDNIRLWDKRPLLIALRQLQQIRLYYNLADADIDRYTLPLSNTPNLSGEGVPSNTRQVMVTARELNQDSIPAQAQTWVNRHLIYTHGYGFVMNPVNTFDAGGLPEYLVKDIGTATDEEGNLWTANEAVRQKIPIRKPRIYYGELTNNYVMTGSKFQELDYPQGDENVYNTYAGVGGIGLGNFWQRALFAWYLRDWQILFTDTFTPETKLLGRRNINQRVREIAPFLRYDRDPYLVAADIDPSQPDSNLFWIIDAYTTSDRYPYADPGNNPFNYIRNSVKVVIDAYNGTVNFYVAYPNDPIIQTWQQVFPNLFQSIEEMPSLLRSHIRYPVDLFSIQSQQLLNYHMTDARVFYNREDQWQIPKEIYGDKPQQVEPYYLILELPDSPSEEFILLLPFTPTERNNMISWLAARSDGENYGKLLLYRFPKQQLTFGPEQIDTRINTDPNISQQISLWNRQGAKAIQGNLLVIPIAKSLLYVEPIYLEAEQNNLPSLVRVVVGYNNQLVMAEDIQQGLARLFPATPPESPDISPN
jgi:uncharacterized membrane protein (UPF0182 family)